MEAAAELAPATSRFPWIIAKAGVLPVALLASVIAGTASGPTAIPFSDVVGIIAGQLGISTGHTWPASLVTIVWDIRLPEVICAVLVGSALAFAGAIFQAVFRNPLCDPFVIGTSSGAMFGVAVAFWIWAGPSAVVITTATWMGFGIPQLFALIGAVGAVALVFALTYTSRRTGPLTFLLAGFAVSTAAIAGMWLAAYQGGHIQLIFGWMMGNLGNSTWSELTVVGPVMLAAMVLSPVLLRDLNALLLGEEHAAHLGVRSVRTRSILIVLGTVVTALAVSIAGIIGFVGLVVPHITRLLYGPDHRILLPASACMGATLLVLCDVVARTVEPGGGELPLGIITAIVGVPVFLLLLLRQGDSYAF